MVLASTVIALSALAASVDAAVLRRHNFPVPATYDAPHLEPYDNYHARYLALSCYTQHNTTFFDDCCHPMLKTEKLETARLPKCIPGSSDNSDDGEDCDDNGDQSSQVPSGPANAANDPADQPSSSESKPAPTPSPAPPPPPPPPAPTSEKPKPTESAKPKPASTSTSKKPKPTGGLSGTLASLFNAFSITSNIFSGGEATWFTQNGNAGNCGTVHLDSDFVVALPTSTYANGAHCGKKIALVDTESGKSATAVVADSCPTCPNPNSLDLSTSLFNKFTDPSKGVFKLAWAFIDA